MREASLLGPGTQPVRDDDDDGCSDDALHEPVGHVRPPLQYGFERSKSYSHFDKKQILTQRMGGVELGLWSVVEVLGDERDDSGEADQGEGGDDELLHVVSP